MNNQILVVEPDDARFLALSKQLSILNYSGEDIYRFASADEAGNARVLHLQLVISVFKELTNEDLSDVRKLYHSFISVPIVVLTDNTDVETQVKAIGNGAQDVLLNGSYDIAQLQKAIAYAGCRKELTGKMEQAYNDYEGHFNNGPIPMWLIDEKTMKFMVVNYAAVEKYGYSREEFQQMTLKDIRPPEDVAAMMENYKTRKSSYYDAGYWRHRKKNGEIFYVHIYSHATAFAGTSARLSFVVDVHEKILAEQKNTELAQLIKEQKEQLDGILYSINDAIWSRRADTMELVYANNAYYKMFGYAAEEMRKDKEHVLNAVYPDDLPMFRQAMQDVLKNGHVEIVYRFRHRDGSLRILRAHSQLKKGISGQPDIINGVTNDITQEKELYDAIRNSEQKLSATINNTKDLIWSINAQLEILYCNEAYQDFIFGLTGIVPEEGSFVLAESTSQSFIDKRIKDYNRALGGESFTTVVEQTYKGDKLYLEISSSPIVNHEGKIAGVNCIARNVTVQRQQLLKIREQNEKLKEIAWIQSHKVRGPVASILGLMQLFDYSAAGNEENADLLLKMKEATTTLDNVIREIVYSINEVDKPEPKPGSESLAHTEPE